MKDMEQARMIFEALAVNGRGDFFDKMYDDAAYFLSGAIMRVGSDTPLDS